MSSTEGSGGGEPLRLSKEPVERPEVIPRGLIYLSGLPYPDCDACRMNFTLEREGFLLHYHEISTTRSRVDGDITATVLPDDVVTWEKLDAQ